MWAALVLGGLAWLGFGGHVLVGGLIISSGFVAAAVLRLVLPPDRAGALHVRNKSTDVVIHSLFAVAVAAATVLIHLRERD